MTRAATLWVCEAISASITFSLIVVAAVTAPTPGTRITRGSFPWLE